LVEGFEDVSHLGQIPWCRAPACWRRPGQAAPRGRLPTHLVDLEIEELPRELRAEFMSVSASLTSRRAMGGLGVIDATVRKLSDAQAAGYARRLITMYGVLSQSQAQAQRAPALRAINSSQA
jgi:hypothetical protein